MNDPIADMLARLRNGQKAGHEEVQVPFSRLKLEIVKILHREGFIGAYRIASKDVKSIEVTLRYLRHLGKRQPAMTNLARISRPGRRVYVGYQEIPKVRNDFGLSILSTPKGILTDREAKKEKVGGEILCTVH